MTKHKKTRKTRRHQKGGDWNPMTWFNTNSNQTSWGDYFSSWGTKTKTGLNDINQSIGNFTESVENKFANATSSFNSGTQPPLESQPQLQQPTYGGKHKRRSKTMRGGKGSLGLTYYATPVSNLKVAEPTTWQHYANGTNQYSTKGGSKKSHRRKRR